MGSSHILDQLDTCFDDTHAVANAGLLLPATLAERLGIEQAADQVIDLGERPGAHLVRSAGALVMLAGFLPLIGRLRAPTQGCGGGGGAVSDLNVVAWGAGEPVVMVHGSFGWGEETWAQQRPLAQRYRLLLLDRRGFGHSPPAEREDFGVDAADIAEVLGDGAHLVGHSYGGLGCLLAAAHRPHAVWSLTLIEPAAFAVARGNQAVERLLGRLRSLFTHAADTRTEDFYVDFLQALGLQLPADVGLTREEVVAAMTPEDLAAIRCSMGQRLPWEAELPLALLAAAPFPKLVVSGGWDRVSAAASRLGGAALGAICDLLAARLGARRAVISGARHSPQLTHPEAFNPRLVAFLASSPRSRLPTS
jgi:pimeloyl-ACP methyl ester carboxylesterase